MADVRALGGSNKAYKLAANEEISVEHLFALPAGRQDISILCAGPNAVYYHTEGDPPGLGANDNGDVAVGTAANFTITAAGPYAPNVYLQARHGPTIAAVFVGPINLAGQVGTNLRDVIKYIQSLF